MTRTPPVAHRAFLEGRRSAQEAADWLEHQRWGTSPDYSEALELRYFAPDELLLLPLPYPPSLFEAWNGGSSTRAPSLE